MNTGDNNTHTKPRVRFAPSPTGSLHIGGLRSALYNFLFARHTGGSFLLRIEDTDRKRLVPGAEQGILDILHTFGMEPDEPFIRQSDRLALYAKATEELVRQGHAYYCFCSEQRLTDLRTQQEAAKQQPRYDGLCRTLNYAEAERRKTTEPHVIRFAIPASETKIHDIIHGESTIQSTTLDDFVILKTDGFPTYHLASVVDDHAMNITHVIRGDEWLPSLPKHILLFQAFGWQPPEYAHLPLLLSASKKKLSKREADVSVESYLKQGYLPEAILNFIALLGWNPSGSQEQYTIQELISAFDITAVNKNGAMVNFEKLRWLNKEYLNLLSFEQYCKQAMPFLQSAKATLTNPATVDDQKLLAMLRERIHLYADITAEEIKFIDQPTITDSTKIIWKKSDCTTTQNNLTEVTTWLSKQSNQFFADPTIIEQAFRVWIGEHGFDLGSILWATRYALSGQMQSPSPFVLLSLLGKTESIARLQNAHQLLSA